MVIRNLPPLSTGGKMGKYALVVALLMGLSHSAFARDDGRYANDPLKYWFDNLTSSNGKCCSFADGFSVSDVEWDTEDGHYRVLLHGQWINVSNSSIVTEPNRYGPAVIWPYMDSNGNIYILPAWSRSIKRALGNRRHGSCPQACLGHRKHPACGAMLSWACFGLRGDEAITAAHVSSFRI